MAITDQLGKMVGPLPLGAWIAIVGGGLGYALYTQRTAPAPVDEEPGRATGTDEGVGMGGSGQWIDLSPPPPSEAAANTIVTNDDWGRAALNILIAKGQDPATASQAVGKYIGGLLTAKDIQEWAMIRIAMATLGSPPLPINNTGGSPTTPIPAAPKPSAPTSTNNGYVYHTVVKDDSIASLAKRYDTTPFDIWGMNNAAGNRQGPMTSQTSIRIGWVLRIPQGKKSKPPAPVKTQPKPQVTYHVVKKGETLKSIAAKYGTTWNKIYGLNNNVGTERGPIRDPNKIQAGWRLRVK